MAFLFSDSTWILYLNWGNFQRKVSGEFMWNSRRICWPPALIENPEKDLGPCAGISLFPLSCIVFLSLVLNTWLYLNNIALLSIHHSYKRANTCKWPLLTIFYAFFSGIFVAVVMLKSKKPKAKKESWKYLDFKYRLTLLGTKNRENVPWG